MSLRPIHVFVEVTLATNAFSVALLIVTSQPPLLELHAVLASVHVFVTVENM